MDKMHRASKYKGGRYKLACPLQACSPPPAAPAQRCVHQPGSSPDLIVKHLYISVASLSLLPTPEDSRLNNLSEIQPYPEAI